MAKRRKKSKKSNGGSEKLALKNALGKLSKIKKLAC